MVYIYIIFSAIVFGGDQKIALEKIRERLCETAFVNYLKFTKIVLIAY